MQPLVDGCLEILEMAIGLAERGTLRFAPVRVFLRTTIASVFLLKYLGLKIGTEKTKIYLDVLVRVIEALKRSTPDDLHLGSRYAALLEMYVLRVQENIAATPRSSNLNTRPTTPEADHAGFLEMLPEPGNFEEGWFGLDPSLGSLLPEDNEGSPGPAHNSLGLLL